MPHEAVTVSELVSAVVTDVDLPSMYPGRVAVSLEALPRADSCWGQSLVPQLVFDGSALSVSLRGCK